MDKERTQQEEVKLNSEAFEKLLPQYIQQNLEGQYALMHDGKVELILKDFHDAVITGNRLFNGKPFSVESITTESINLGFYSYTT